MHATHSNLESDSQVLTDELPALVGSISFKKSMRWRGDTGERRSKPKPIFQAPLPSQPLAHRKLPVRLPLPRQSLRRTPAQLMQRGLVPGLIDPLHAVLQTPGSLKLHLPPEAAADRPVLPPTRLRHPCLDPAAAYSRPMRWLLALHGDTPLPFVYGPILAGAATRVLRNAAQPEQRVGSAEEYEQLLARCGAARRGEGRGAACRGTSSRIVPGVLLLGRSVWLAQPEGVQSDCVGHWDAPALRAHSCASQFSCRVTRVMTSQSPMTLRLHSPILPLNANTCLRTRVRTHPYTHANTHTHTRTHWLTHAAQRRLSLSPPIDTHLCRLRSRSSAPLQTRRLRSRSSAPLQRERITLDLERRRQDIWAATVAAAAEVRASRWSRCTSKAPGGAASWRRLPGATPSPSRAPALPRRYPPSALSPHGAGCRVRGGRRAKPHCRLLSPLATFFFAIIIIIPTSFMPFNLISRMCAATGGRRGARVLQG
jgi:hypothetical protein